MEDMCLFNFFNFPLLRGTHNEGISHLYLSLYTQFSNPESHAKQITTV